MDNNHGDLLGEAERNRRTMERDCLRYPVLEFLRRQKGKVSFQLGTKHPGGDSDRAHENKRAGGSQCDSPGDESLDYHLLRSIFASLPPEPSVSSDISYPWADDDSLSSSSTSESGSVSPWYSDETPGYTILDWLALMPRRANEVCPAVSEMPRDAGSAT